MSTKNKTNIIVEPGKQELFITREFDAPRELVFKAYTDPELYAQWLGPHATSPRGSKRLNPSAAASIDLSKKIKRGTSMRFMA